MEPSLVVVGIDFRTAPVAMRERFWIGQPRLRQALAYLSDAEGVEEAVVQVTCERTEFVIWANDAALAANSVLRLLSSEYDLQLCEWKNFYRLMDEGALEHLFRVASGLASFTPGDPHIVCNLRRAWEEAQKSGSGANHLDTVLQKALVVGEKVRGAVRGWPTGLSVVSIAADLAKQTLGSLQRSRVVLIGAGYVGEMAAVCLAHHGVTSLRILNRTFEHAVQVANKVGGTAVPMEDLVQEIAVADLVISCTSSPEALISAEQADRIMRERKGERLCIVDLGLPRNVDAGVREIAQVVLYDLDDVHDAAFPSHDECNPAAQAAENIIKAEAGEIYHHLAGEHATPMVRALRARLDQLCQEELQAFRQEFGPFPRYQDQMLAHFVSRMTQRLATSLARQVKDVPEKAEQQHMKEVVHRLFHLQGEKQLVGSMRAANEKAG